MMQIVLFLVAIALAAYLIPILAYLVRRKPARAPERPLQRRMPKLGNIRAQAGTKALDRMVQLVEDNPSPHRPEPETADRSDKVVRLR